MLYALSANAQVERALALFLHIDSRVLVTTCNDQEYRNIRYARRNAPTLDIPRNAWPQFGTNHESVRHSRARAEL